MFYTDFVLRISLSLVLGFLIGLERQLTGHPAGIRINVLICMGTSFFTLFPMLYGSDQVFRVGSSIISGVGFLCSGVIFKDSGTVRGMNTAATLWCTAAIGILASTGMYAMAITAAGILIVSNYQTLEGVRKYGLYMYLFRSSLYFCRLLVCLWKRIYSSFCVEKYATGRER